MTTAQFPPSYRPKSIAPSPSSSLPGSTSRPYGEGGRGFSGDVGNEEDRDLSLCPEIDDVEGVEGIGG